MKWIIIMAAAGLSGAARAAEFSELQRLRAAEITAAAALPEAAADKITSRFDTSGCSAREERRQKGPVAVSVALIPRRNCWNLGDGGISLEYQWTQVNNNAPQKTNIGFWFSLNGSAQYGKAASYDCRPAPQAGYGPDTSGNAYYLCAASASFQFRAYPRLLDFAYDQSGSRKFWDLQAAVSLDDAGNWDSLNGSNYSFRF